MKAYGGVDVQIHIFLTSALAGVLSFTPLPLYPRERAPGTHWIGNWVGPIAGACIQNREFHLFSVNFTEGTAFRELDVKQKGRKL
jgi:hypothetical protein